MPLTERLISWALMVIDASGFPPRGRDWLEMFLAKGQNMSFRRENVVGIILV